MTLSTWQPPANYIPLQSAIAGITVYGPRPGEDAAKAAEAPVTFKCPNCGATTKFDVAAGGVACEHCGHVAQARATVVGYTAAQSEFTLEALNKAEKGWGVARQELHCESCGADLALAAETLSNRALTATCPFCASHNVNLRAAQNADAIRPRFLIPFKFKPEDTLKTAKHWLGQGWFHPDELAKSAHVSRFAGVYLPFWTFSAHITADWKAEVGYERQESYYDSDSKEWQTRTVIDWRWESGRVEVPLENWLTPGTSRVSNALLRQALPFQLGDLVTYSPDYLAGWQAQAYDVTLPKAWETGKAEMREEAKRACYRDIPTSHVRSFSMTGDFADESWRYVLLPMYLTAYKFESKTYQVMVNGQTGKIVGQKPVAWWKVWLAIAAIMLPGLGFGLIGLLLSLVTGPFGVVALGLAGIAFVIGIAVAGLILQRAVSSEKA
jgi:Zn finger protein HypA/HybF involved in hydrogenase expression